MPTGTLSLVTEPKRPDPPMTGDERTQLNGFLDFLRATVVWKSAGLTDEQARASHVPSELTTIAGLVGHLTLVEDHWFGLVLDDREDKWKEALAEDPDAEFRQAMKTPISQVLAEYEAQCEVSREIVAKLDLDAVFPFRGDRQVSVRWVLIHMIEETSRHAGHLDLLRELTDGATGE
ncbi:MAG: hypothetical protein QOI21_1215 [Actinomycetota bacterium]|nr:hypothetical protein [Actinomycetota bacterium]